MSVAHDTTDGTDGTGGYVGSVGCVRLGDMLGRPEETNGRPIASELKVIPAMDPWDRPVSLVVAA